MTTPVPRCICLYFSLGYDNFSSQKFRTERDQVIEKNKDEDITVNINNINYSKNSDVDDQVYSRLLFPVIDHHLRVHILDDIFIDVSI